MSLWQKTRDWFAEGVEVIRNTRSALSDDQNAWEWAIARFEAQDRRQPPPAAPVVFTGSSSVTFWNTLARDMAPLAVLNRGFGGSTVDQVTRYTARIVLPYAPAAVVLFAGTNDIAGRHPKTPEQVYEGWRAFVETVRDGLPDTPIYFISITPTPSRWQLWPLACEANELIRADIAAGRCLDYIDLVPAILGPDGKPRSELYRWDKLHPSQKGYAAWTRVIRPVLLAGLPAAVNP